MTSPLTPFVKIPVTRTLTLSLKNTIPTLALLVAIFMLSGCIGQTLNKLASQFEEDAKNGLGDLEDELDDINKKGTGNLPDTCIVRKTCVDYTHWATANAANPTTTPTANRFLTGTATGLTTGRSSTGTVLGFGANATEHNLSGESAPGGFAIFRAGTTHNVGLLSTTRFEAPWRNAAVPNAQWLGSFRVQEGVTAIKSSNITLTVNFSGTSGTITGTNDDGNGEYYVDATYDNFGVMGGTITRTVGAVETTGTVSGLVGVHKSHGAAVGVFYSNSNQGAAESYVGGFVASGAPKTAPGS